MRRVDQFARALPDSAVHAPTITERDWKQALVRGVKGKCPACGRGRMFARFLKPVDRCKTCGEDLSHQRADDFPPYIVILLLGHLLAPVMIELDQTVHPPLWAYMTFGPLAAAVLGLLLIQPVKGGVIGYQWAYRMHGFGDDGAELTATREH